MVQHFIHYFLHLVFPIAVAWVFFREDWKKVYLIFLATMLVDIDHLLADPMFQANRCSVGFHYLHSFWAIGVYVLMLFYKRTYRIIAIGLLMHMATDLCDCMFMYNACRECQQGAPALSIMRFLWEFFGS